MALSDYAGGPYKELDGSMAGGFGSSTGFTRKFHVGWADQFDFCKSIIGYPIFTSGSTFPPSNPGLSRIKPDPYPLAPWLYCRNVDIQPQGCISKSIGLGSGPYYPQGVFIDAHYEPIDFRLDGPSAYLTETVDGVTQFTSVENRHLVWDSDSKQLDDPPGLPFRGVDYVMVWHEVPDGAINWGTLYNAQNSLNNAPVQIGIWSNIPLGCMLFLKFEAHSTHPPDGSKAWELTYHMHLRNQDHNKALRGSTAQWEYFRWDSGAPATRNRPPTQTLIPYLDMTTLWTWPMP